MNARDRLALWKVRRRLRALQKAYYDGSPSDNTAVLEYFRTLDAARAIVAAPTSCSLHLGCGDHRVNGWVNVDADLAMPVDVAADFRSDLPLRSDSIEFIHSEDLLEHLDEASGRHLLAECFRVLRRGGVMRLLTPDLRALIDEIYVRREPRHLRWCGTYLSANGPCEALNMHLRMNGEHRFVYDEEHLVAVLRAIGFDVRRVSWNRSPVPALRFLDLRDFGLNLFLEAVKP